MTTDTKAVARWDIESQDGRDCLHLSREDGDYVLFTDHERVVGELQWEGHKKVGELVNEIDTLRTALAASRAEVEGLRRELGLVREWAINEKKPLRKQEIESITRALENGNV